MDLRVIDRIEHDEALHSELWLNETESYTLSDARKLESEENYNETLRWVLEIEIESRDPYKETVEFNWTVDFFSA